MLRKILDSKNHSGWLILSTFLFMVGIFISFFIPVFITLIRFQTDSKIEFSPSVLTYWYSIAAFFLFSLGLYFVYKFTKKFIRIISFIGGFVLFFLVMSFAFNSYTYVDEAYLQFGNGISENKYAYSDIKELYYNSNEASDWFEIVMNDGKKYEVVFGGLISTSSKNYIRRSAEEFGVYMIDISK